MFALAAGTAGVLVLLIMLRAAVHKSLDFTEFQGFVADYRIVPARHAAQTAAVVVIAEWLLVGLIVWPATRSAGLTGAACLLAAYGAIIARNLRRGHTHIECGCGGAPQVLSASLVVRNVMLAGLALFAAACAPSALTLAAALAVVATGAFSLALYALFEQLNANRMYLTSRGL
ncbi:methylamine utilization protein MauE [Salinisphaera sp. T31B1]